MLILLHNIGGFCLKQQNQGFTVHSMNRKQAPVSADKMVIYACTSHNFPPFPQKVAQPTVVFADLRVNF